MTVGELVACCAVPRSIKSRAIMCGAAGASCPTCAKGPIGLLRFEHRLAGHVETDRDSISDPALGGLLTLKA
jgi:hypothetical protein